jgi:hypothetical protein
MYYVISQGRFQNYGQGFVVVVAVAVAVAVAVVLSILKYESSS